MNKIGKHNLLFNACSYERKDVIELLIEHGVDTDVKNKDGLSLLSVALKTGIRSLINLIRNELIKTYDLFNNLTTNELRQQVVNSLDNSELSVIKWQYLKAFQLLIKTDDTVNNNDTSLNVLREKNILQFFNSFEFKEILLEDIINRDVKGDFIEAGVWKGGLCIFAAAIFQAYQHYSRKVYLADSFDGIPKSNVKKLKYRDS